MPFKSQTFYELNLSEKFDATKLDVLSRLGYKTVAINQVIDESIFEVKKKNKKGEPRDNSDVIPPPPLLVPKDLKCNLKILHRLTIEFSEVSVSLKLNQSENIKKYDLLAVIPTSVTAFSHACTTMDVDIISFSPENKCNIKMNRKLYKQAIDRGIYFEIMYAPALKNSNYRKNIIHKAHLYYTIGKSANILITSGAETEFQVRGPYDIINLGLILGLSEQQCKNSIIENARKAILRAGARKMGKAAVFVSRKSDEPSLNTEGVTNDDESSDSKRMKMETE